LYFLIRRRCSCRIVVIVVFFPEGIMGWLREKYPEKFGEVVDEADRKAQVELK